MQGQDHLSMAQEIPPKHDEAKQHTPASVTKNQTEDSKGVKQIAESKTNKGEESVTKEGEMEADFELADNLSDFSYTPNCQGESQISDGSVEDGEACLVTLVEKQDTMSSQISQNF
ncbi:hypothetical protein V6N12_025614 [Hibiscus sabdariffa]|uniref:Uncharacterized protein n=1 Tax=Hibiscus sabdariffa TaxID=183260 RepID=A0ABR2CJ04_9ROSI